MREIISAMEPDEKKKKKNEKWKRKRVQKRVQQK